MINSKEVENISDEELVILTLKNQDYFLFLINRYKTKLFNYVRRITNIDPEDAEDVLQDVFIKIYLNLNDFDHGYKFSTWAYSITRNQVISNFRKLKVRPEGNSISIDDKIANRIAGSMNIEKDVDSAYLKVAICKILEKLKPKYSEVLMLKYLEEKDYEEISDIIKKPIGTVGSLINRAKKEFKNEFEKQNIKL
ncbi:MAG: RNA polymerase sigma factor [Candidatus Falkowbacteria bacterium]|nr:RNA polymerase sigma factor [Candidatus Falkowbacteria bacterium]